MFRLTSSRRIFFLAFLSGILAAFQGEAAEPAGELVPRTVGRSPAQGLRPIGAPSAVDRFTRPATVPSLEDPPVAQPVLPPSAAAGQIAQTAYMQGGGFAMPPEGSSTAPSAPPSAPPSGSPAPRPAPAVTGGNAGGGLQAPPLSGGSSQPTAAPPASTPPLPAGLQPVPSTAPLTAPPQRGQPSYPLTASPSDAAPVPQPQLGSTWATADNCNLVSYPSGYRAEFGPCGPAPVIPMAYTAPPAVVVPPTIMPGVAPPVAFPATAGHRPLFTLGQENYNVQLGQGIIGQPKAYVPGQYVRNFIRYFSP